MNNEAEYLIYPGIQISFTSKIDIRYSIFFPNSGFRVIDSEVKRSRVPVLLYFDIRNSLSIFDILSEFRVQG